MSLFRSAQFNVWFPAIVVGFFISLVVAALWDFIRRRFWLVVSKGSPNILKEVGLDSRYQSRVEAEDQHRETIDKLNKIARGMNLPKSSNSGATIEIDIEAQTMINPHHDTLVIHMAGTSAIQGMNSINSSLENHMYPGETFQGVECRPIINFTSYFPDGTPKDVTRSAKKLYKRHANGQVKRIKSSIILQASIAIDAWVLAEIVEFAKYCMTKENKCIFQLGNWAVLYHNAGEVHMHLLKEGDVPLNVGARWQDGKTSITMRGLYLTGSQVKVGTKWISKFLQSDGPATQGVGDLDELHLPTREFDILGEDSLIYASKVVVVDGVSLIVRSEASFILLPQEKNTLIEAIWTQWLWISNSSKKMLLSLLFGAKDYQSKPTSNCLQLEFDANQLKLSVEHWKGLSEIELLNTRKEVLLYLQEQGESGIIENVGFPSPHSHFIFVRDEHYLECWHEGLRVLNEVIHWNSNDSHSHTHVRVRGGIQFLLGDYDNALEDYDSANLNTGEHQSTILLNRALVKCMLGRFSEAMQDVVAVITLNPNVNDIQELRACIQHILDQQRAFRIVTESCSSCQRPLLPDQENEMVEIPDLLTGDEWHSGEIGSLPPTSDAGTVGGSASDPPLKHAKSVGVARAADGSMTSIAEALKLQLKLTNRDQSLRMNPRYHVRQIQFIVNIMEDECDPDAIMNSLSMEDQGLLNWQAPTEDLQGDLDAGSDLMCLSERLCPYKNISHTLSSNVTADDSNVQRRGPYPLSCYQHVSFRSAMLTKHSAAEEDVQTLFLYDGTPLSDRRFLRWRSHDYIKELVLPEARSPYRAFWLVQWDVVDMWHVVQGGPDRDFCSNPASVERQDDLGKLLSLKLLSLGYCPTSNGNGLNRHRTKSRMSLPVNEKPQTSLQTQPLRPSGVDSVFITISENSTSGGDSTVDSSSMNAYERKSFDSFHYHNGDEEAASEVLRSADTHRICEECNPKDETQELETENGLQVAVKRGSYYDLSRSIFEQESALLAELTHPNICALFEDAPDIEENSPRNSLVMELIELDLADDLSRYIIAQDSAVMKGRIHDLSRSISEQESAVLAGLTRPNTCKFLKTSRTGLPATELMKHDLRSIVDSRLKGIPQGSSPFPCPVHVAIDIMLQTAKNMMSLNDYKVAHLDLKPDNVLCTPLHTLAESGSAFRPEHNYSVELADVELVRSQIQSSDGEPLLAGASRYKALEMLELLELQRKADVYSIGIICCEILTGELPFEEYRHQRLSLLASRPLDSHSHSHSQEGVPEALKKLILQCLDSNPAQRPTFDHIVMKLRECKCRLLRIWETRHRPHCLTKANEDN